MSDLTKCNHCSLKAMRERAARRGATVIIGKEEGWTTARYSDQKKVSARFLSLTNHCVC